MKNNCLNAKHKLAILTLLLGCIASLAWVKPFAQDTEPTEMHVLPAVAVDTVAALAADSAKTIVFRAVASDTLPSNRKSNITFTGSDGATQTFESYEDLSDSLKIEVDAARQRADSIKAYFDSPEWKEEQRKITVAVRKQTDSIKAYFDSPQWKEEQRKITVEIRKQTESIKDYFSSPEWKEEQRKMTEQVRKQTDSIKAYFSSPEWKDQMKGYMDSVKLFFNSPEKGKVEQMKHEPKEADTIKIRSIKVLDAEEPQIITLVLSRGSTGDKKVTTKQT